MKIPVRMNGSPVPEDGSMAPEEETAAGGNDGETITAEEWKNRFVRLSADFDNFRRHANIERERLAGLGKEAVLEDVVPLVGDLERAKQAVETAPDKAAILAGLDLIYKQLLAALEKHGIERIPAQGQPFDPNIHEAVGVYACNDVEDNTVIEEVKPGFRRHGKVIRPAAVVVAQKIIP
jgi:molecular chaperone GrpE